MTEYSAGKAKHEKDDSHFAAGDKGSEAGEQTKRDQEAAHQFNPAAPIAPSFCCGISARREMKKLLLRDIRQAGNEEFSVHRDKQT